MVDSSSPDIGGASVTPPLENNAPKDLGPELTRRKQEQEKFAAAHSVLQTTWKDKFPIGTNGKPRLPDKNVPGEEELDFYYKVLHGDENAPEMKNIQLEGQGNPLYMPNFTDKGQEYPQGTVTITQIDEIFFHEGKRYARVKLKSGADVFPMNVLALDVADAQLASDPEKILGMVDNPQHKNLVAAYVDVLDQTIGKDPIATGPAPSDADIKAIEEASYTMPNDPDDNDTPKTELKRRESFDDFINMHTAALKKEIDVLKKSALKKNSPQREQLIMLLRDLNKASLEEGTAGAFYRLDALNKLKNELNNKRQATKTSLESDAAAKRAGLDQQIAALDHHVKDIQDGPLSDTKESLKTFLKEKLGEKHIKEFNRLLPMLEKDDPSAVVEALNSVITNTELMKIDGMKESMNELIFGKKDMDPKKVTKLIEDSYSGETKKLLWRIAKIGGASAGIGLLALLLGLPVAMALGMVEAAKTGAGAVAH